MSKDFNDIFIERLNFIIDQKTIVDHISIEQQMEELDIRETTMKRYRKGASLPNVQTLKNIADYYNVTADYLIGRTNNPYSSFDKSEICDNIGISGSSYDAVVDYFDRAEKSDSAIYRSLLDLILSNKLFYAVLRDQHILTELKELSCFVENDFSIFVKQLFNLDIKNTSLTPDLNQCLTKDFDKASIIMDLSKNGSYIISNYIVDGQSFFYDYNNFDVTALNIEIKNAIKKYEGRINENINDLKCNAFNNYPSNINMKLKDRLLENLKDFPSLQQNSGYKEKAQDIVDLLIKELEK